MRGAVCVFRDTVDRSTSVPVSQSCFVALSCVFPTHPPTHFSVECPMMSVLGYTFPFLVHLAGYDGKTLHSSGWEVEGGKSRGMQTSFGFWGGGGLGGGPAVFIFHFLAVFVWCVLFPAILHKHV